jgi:hypothetical protein
MPTYNPSKVIRKYRKPGGFTPTLVALHLDWDGNFWLINDELRAFPRNCWSVEEVEQRVSDGKWIAEDVP